MNYHNYYYCYHYYVYIVDIIVTIQLSGECQIISIFLNHLSLVEQGTCKYMGCSWLSTPETNLVQHYLLVSLENLYTIFLFDTLYKLYYISSCK